jgi:hypothetical protein
MKEQRRLARCLRVASPESLVEVRRGAYGLGRDKASQQVCLESLPL